MRRVEMFDTSWAMEGRAYGRVWRLWMKSWAWPYAFHRWGVRCAGVGPFGFMLFDKEATDGE